MKINNGNTAVGTPLGVNILKKNTPCTKRPFTKILNHTILANKKVKEIWLVSVNTKGKIPNKLEKNIVRNKNKKKGTTRKWAFPKYLTTKSQTISYIYQNSKKIKLLLFFLLFFINLLKKTHIIKTYI